MQLGRKISDEVIGVDCKLEMKKRKENKNWTEIRKGESVHNLAQLADYADPSSTHAVQQRITAFQSGLPDDK